MSSAFAAMRSRYQRALALHWRSWVAKSTRTRPKRAGKPFDHSKLSMRVQQKYPVHRLPSAREVPTAAT